MKQYQFDRLSIQEKGNHLHFILTNIKRNESSIQEDPLYDIALQLIITYDDDVDTYSFNILKTGSETYVVIASQTKTS